MKDNPIDSTNRYERCVYATLKKIYTEFITQCKKNRESEMRTNFDVGVESALNGTCITLKNAAFVFNFSFENMLDLKEPLPLSVTTPLIFEDEVPDEDDYQAYLEEAARRLREYLLDAIAEKKAKKDDFHAGYAHGCYWALQTFREQAIGLGITMKAIKFHEPIPIP